MEDRETVVSLSDALNELIEEHGEGYVADLDSWELDALEALQRIAESAIALRS